MHHCLPVSRKETQGHMHTRQPLSAANESTAQRTSSTVARASRRAQACERAATHHHMAGARGWGRARRRTTQCPPHRLCVKDVHAEVDAVCGAPAPDVKRRANYSHCVPLARRWCRPCGKGEPRRTRRSGWVTAIKRVRRQGRPSGRAGAAGNCAPANLGCAQRASRGAYTHMSS